MQILLGVALLKGPKSRTSLNAMLFSYLHKPPIHGSRDWTSQHLETKPEHPTQRARESQGEGDYWMLCLI